MVREKEKGRIRADHTLAPPTTPPLARTHARTHRPPVTTIDGRVTASRFGSLPNRGLSVTESKRARYVGVPHVA